MFRTLVPRTVPQVAMRPITRAPLASYQVVQEARHARYNSTNAPGTPQADTQAAAEEQTKKELDPRKAWLEKQDDMQRDWDAKVLTYEELKPRTQQPSPVRDDYVLHNYLC